MTLGAVRVWARRRTEVEWVALATALAVFAYVGWDGALWDARFQLLLHLFAIGAIAGLAVIGLRGGLLPRTPIDVPLLGLLAAFAVATASALNVGMSLRAMAVILASAAMLPVALVAIRARPSWVGLVVGVPVFGLSLISLVALVVRRAEWVLVGAPGLPPIRLPAEGTPFGSVAVPPFVIWPAWALAGLIESPRWRRAVQGALVAVGIPLTILSGSRSAWLATGVVVVVALAPWAWRHRHRLLSTPRLDTQTVAVGLAALLAVALVGAVVAPRLTAIGSLVYRASLWRDTLNAWSSDPLLGIGPGFMPYARQAAAPDFSFPVRQPHSHNLPLGVLGDAGVVGLLAALVLVATIAWVAGPWRSRTRTGRAAALVLLGLGVGGLFEDLTFLPNFNLLAIGLLSVALIDAGAVGWRPLPGGARRLALAAGGAAVGVALLAAMVTADAGAVAYRSGVDAAAADRWTDATDRLLRSTRIDPWHPAGPKALAVAADAAGRTELARDAAATAVARNPGDAPSWVNLALLCGRLGDEACAADASARAVATAAFGEPELANAALSYEALGRTDAADDAYRRSLLADLRTSLALDWPRAVTIDGAEPQDVSGSQVELARLLALWSTGEPIDPGAFGDLAVRALAHAIRGEDGEAESLIERAIETQPGQVLAWDVAIVMRDHQGRSTQHERAIAAVVRGSELADREPSPTLPALSFDIASFRAYPRDELVAAAARLRTDPTYPWVLERTLP